jgi:lipopolysaccharide heptosyltransferase I
VDIGRYEGAMKILIVKLSSIGDVVQTLPALCALRSGHPDARIDWLVEEAARDVIRDHPLLDEMIVVKNRGWLKDLGENLKTARYIAGKGYDMVLDFQGLFKSGIWVLLSRGTRRIGFSNAREMSHIFLNERLPPYNLERHAVCRYLDLAKYAGGELSPEEPIFSFPISEGDKQKVKMFLKEGGMEEGSPFFIINPSARWETKLWPDSRFAELITLATKRFDMKAVLVGSSYDNEKAMRINSMAGRAALNLAGRTTLKELAYLMSEANFVITVDSGPMHIAAAMGARVFALFGPTAPWRTGPYGAEHRVIRNGLDCSPCFQKRCNEFRCMDEISVEDVIGAIAEQKEFDGRVA